MDQEFAVIADRDDAAGDRAVFRRIDGEGFGRFDQLVAAFLEPCGFGHHLVGQVVLGEFLDCREALLDLLQLGGDLGREFGRLRLDAPELPPEAVIEIEHRLGPGPMRRAIRAAFASSFSIASRRTSAASSMKPSSSPLNRSRVTLPPAAS